MRISRQWTRWSVLGGLVAALGCNSLDVENPNAPDAERAFSDPTAVAGLITGGFRNWFNAREEFNSSLVLNAMADGLSASWNNFNLRYYSSDGFTGADAGDCPYRCGWDNRPASALRFQIETFWYGYYGVLSNANDVLIAIRKNNVVVGSQANTKRLEAIAVMLQGMVFAQIALNYDQGFIVTEDTDLTNVAELPLATRAELRDAAITKFSQAIALMQATQFTSDPAWTGKAGGPTYSSAQLIQLIRTMQAEALALYPRTAAENGQVNWGQVAQFASQGLTYNFTFTQDAYAGDFYSGVKDWGNDVGTMRVDTRVARLITDGPEGEVKRHKDPWPVPNGNPQPNAFDRRVGNGTWGPANDFNGVGTIKQDAGAGTDYAYAALAIFRPARGQHHQSNLGYIRYSYLAYPGYGLPGEDGTGPVVVYSKTMNDLLWAEGLIRSNGSLTQAATLINNTRVARGGLPALTGAEGQAALLAALQYEQDIELITIGASNFYNRRRIDGLKQMTPRHMPIPAKELLVLQRELYTFGGPANPAGLAPRQNPDEPAVKNVRQIAEEIFAYSRSEAKRRNRR
jgi:hypothetical protein